MRYLGLGGNLGTPIESFRNTIRLLKSKGVGIHRISRVYRSQALMPEGAPSSWDKDYFNAAIQIESTGSLKELLGTCKEIEATLGRDPEADRWAPRTIDLDILWDSEERLDENDLKVPHPGLFERPFALLPLNDIIDPEDRSFRSQAGPALDSWRQDPPLMTRIDFNETARLKSPELVGILNITPDSFSDGGVHADPARAIGHLQNLIGAGASIVDIGAESTRPGATALDPNSEWSRLEPFFDSINEKEFKNVRLSLDSRFPENQERAIERGVHWINDVQGAHDKKTLDLVRNSDAALVFMHSLSIPEDRSKHLRLASDPVYSIVQWLEEKLRTFDSAGISHDKLIFDPGIGFGKLGHQSLELIKRSSELKRRCEREGIRLLLGHSRKSFFEEMTATPPAERDLETLGVSMAVANHVDYLRVHDVGAHKRAFMARWSAE